MVKKYVIYIIIMIINIWNNNIIILLYILLINGKNWLKMGRWEDRSGSNDAFEIDVILFVAFKVTLRLVQ